MTFRIATAAALAFALATPALAQMTGDRAANFEKFEGGDYKSFSDNYGKSGRFERVDTDKDGMISRDEQMRYEFGRYDRDRDEAISLDEANLLNKEYEEELIGGNPDGQ